MGCPANSCNVRGDCCCSLCDVKKTISRYSETVKIVEEHKYEKLLDKAAMAAANFILDRITKHEKRGSHEYSMAIYGDATDENFRLTETSIGTPTESPIHDKIKHGEYSFKAHVHSHPAAPEHNIYEYATNFSEADYLLSCGGKFVTATNDKGVAVTRLTDFGPKYPMYLVGVSKWSPNRDDYDYNKEFAVLKKYTPPSKEDEAKLVGIIVAARFTTINNNNNSLFGFDWREVWLFLQRRFGKKRFVGEIKEERDDWDKIWKELTQNKKNKHIKEYDDKMAKDKADNPELTFPDCSWGALRAILRDILVQIRIEDLGGEVQETRILKDWCQMDDDYWNNLWDDII